MLKLGSVIGLLPKIEPPELLEVLRKIARWRLTRDRRRRRATASSVFRFGIASGYCKRDPAADLRGALTTATRFLDPAITEPKQIGDLLRAIEQAQPDHIEWR